MKKAKFKMTEIGLVPEDWDVKRLGEVCETSSGGTPSRSNLSYYDGNIKWFTTTELQDCNLYDSNEHISRDALKKSSAKIFPCGTLLMAMYGATIGRLGVLRTEAATNQACCAIFCGNLIDTVYTYYYLYHSRLAIIEKGCGAGQPNISQEIVRSLWISLPPLPEQKAIAEALSDVDELLAAMTTLIEKKRAIKQGAMQELLIGKKRLPGFGGKCRQESLETEDFNAEAQRRRGSECKMTEVGLIPLDWEVKRLGEIGESIRGVSFKPEQTSHTLIPNSTMLLRANNIQNNQIVCQDVVYVMNECIADYQQLIKGDVLICSANGSRNLVGKAAIWSKESSATFGAFMAVFRCSKGVDSCFVGYLFQSKHYRMQLDDILTGSAINNLNAKDIDELNFAFPSLAEQKAIAEVLSDMDAEIEALEAKRAKCESIKQGMMQELLTGKTRLKGA